MKYGTMTVVGRTVAASLVIGCASAATGMVIGWCIVGTGTAVVYIIGRSIDYVAYQTGLADGRPQILASWSGIGLERVRARRLECVRAATSEQAECSAAGSAAASLQRSEIGRVSRMVSRAGTPGSD